MRTILIVGAGLAGLRAAEQLRATGWSERIVVIGDERHAPYNRTPLTKAALRDGVDLAALTLRQRPSIDDVEWRLGTAVAAADLSTRTLRLSDGSAMEYDGLVVASGVSARRLALDAPHRWRHTVRTVDDARALHDQLVDGARVIVLGAGFIGCEIAATAISRRCRVTVVEPLAVPLRRALGWQLGTEIQRRHQDHGVRFRVGRTVTALEVGGSAPRTVVLDDGTRLDADVVVESVGSTANTRWLEGQGLDLTDGVLCDQGLHPVRGTGSLPEVVAVGDVARFPVPLLGPQPLRIEHWTMPGDTAGHAARSLVSAITGAPADGPAFGPVPTFWTEQYGTRIQALGAPHLGQDDVRVLDGDPSGEAALGYHRDGVLVGVVLVGMAQHLVSYRRALLEQSRDPARLGAP